MASALKSLIYRNQRAKEQFHIFVGLKRTDAPIVEPVTLTEIKAHLRIDGTDEDALLVALSKSSRLIAENYTNRSFIIQGWQVVFDAFPIVPILKIPMGDLQSVIIKTFDESNTENEFPNTNYLVDTFGDRVILNQGAAWPSNLRGYNSVAVDYVAGYGLGNDIPQDIKQAILLIVGHLYEHRETVIQSSVGGIQKIPLGAMAMLEPYSRKRI